MDSFPAFFPLAGRSVAIAGEGEDATYAWGDMIFKRPAD